jgi:UDP-N-acetylglucosamine--N-acetylmuramyl-(pentapeptide) pyrophosphoryl-undecaprenol N-acetylglucosamine transferase
MRLLIAGGGTGGHLFPGVALVEELRARDPDAEVLFVGTARGIEARVVPQLGYPLRLIDASGLKTVGALGALRGLFKVPRALWQSRKILAEFRPDVVVGVGGYASGPVVLAAWLRRIPTAILEQNSIPGLTNKILGKIARVVFLAFEGTKQFFPASRIVMSGNPIRAKLRATAPIPGDRFHIFCFGGSLGAKAVNALVIDAAALLAERKIDFRLVHQTGKEDKAAVVARYQDMGLADRVDVRDFIDDMGAEYARADLVVARAGATTVAELTAIGRPALLIPYPFAADNHQEKNALALAAAGAALVFKQADLTAAKLAETLADLANDRSRLDAMASAMKALGRPDAAKDVVDRLAGLEK